MTTLVILILPRLHRLHRQVLTNVSMTTLSWYCSSFLGYTDKYYNVSMTTLVLLILPRLHRKVLERFLDNPYIALTS